MPTYELLPGEGIPPIRFGMTPDQVRQMMGEPDRASGPGGQAVLGAWEFGALLVNTDENYLVSYLEVSSLPGVRALYRGVSVFEVPASEAATAVCGGQPQDEFLCADFEADVGMSSCDGDHWDSIGIGSGSYFRSYWERDQERKRSFEQGNTS